MNLETLSPPNRELLMQALPNGRLENILYNDGARLELGFARERRCFALGERGWLEFLGWEGAPRGGARWLSRWALSHKAQALLAAA
jgi:hypothetical protein